MDDPRPTDAPPPSATPCPGPAIWADLRQTAGASADGLFLEHVRACPECLERLERLAAEWSRDSLVAAGTGVTTPGSDALVERLLDHPPEVEARPPAPVLEGLEDLVEVGRGGMGVVYRARDARLDRTVAVKILTSAPALSAEARRRADREARLLARIAHPNIVRILSVTDADGLPAIVMEWIDGEALDGRGRGGGVPLVEAVRIVRDLAGAVAAMHEAGVVHRDIKPANVLLATRPGGGDPVPKLIDFGLARPDDEPGHAVTGANVTVGTPAFMAPEQTGLDPALGPVGPAADIHGLGALLFWLLSGRVPYEGRTTAAVLKQAADGATPPLSALVPRLPADVGTIVAACLEREPGRRYRSAAALADDLSRFLDGRSILARRAGPLKRAQRWARRRPAAAAVVAAGALVAVAAIVGIAHHVRSLARSRAAVAAKEGEAIEAARLARESFARLTDESAERFLGRGQPLDAADRDHLLALRDRYRDWPLKPDEQASLHFRAAGLARLTNLFFEHRWLEETLDTARLCMQALADIDRRGLSTSEEVQRAGSLPRLERELLGRLGRVDEAIAATRAAIAALGPRAGADAAFGADLAVAWGDLGNLESRAGRIAEARAAYTESLQGFDRVASAAPDDARGDVLGLTVLYNAAVNSAFLDDPPARRAILEKLVVRATAGLERFPNDPQGFHKGLSLGLALLAAADLEVGNAAAALARAERRADLARRLAAVHPCERAFRDDLVSAAVQRFHCLRALGRPGDARAGLDEAEASAMEAFAEEPAVLQRSWVLAEVLAFKAMMEEATGRRAEALALHRRLRDVILPWLKDDGSPEPFPITLAEVTAGIERLEAEERAPGATSIAPAEPSDRPLPGANPAD